MKVLITGITGNLGYEVSLDMMRRGVKIVPCIRSGKESFLSQHGINYDQVVVADLVEDNTIDFSDHVDCIIHCAGNVRFKDTHNSNEKMMLNVVALAKKISAPIYFASTAFLYKSSHMDEFNNKYERDKYRAEQILIASGVPYTIFRPSILTGNSTTGEIINFTGYYQIILAFLMAVKTAIHHKRPLRFPRMTGKSNLVPVNQAAESMGDIIVSKQIGKILYVVNPKPPQCNWILDETLTFFGVRQNVNELEISFDEFSKLDLTEEELSLKRFIMHYMPYWSLEYEFPESLCKHNVINQDYLNKALIYYKARNG